MRERKHAVHGRINKKMPAYTKFSQKDAGENKIAKLSQNYHKNMFRGKIAKPWLSHNTASYHRLGTNPVYQVSYILLRLNLCRSEEVPRCGAAHQLRGLY